MATLRRARAEVIAHKDLAYLSACRAKELTTTSSTQFLLPYPRCAADARPDAHVQPGPQSVAKVGPLPDAHPEAE